MKLFERIIEAHKLHPDWNAGQLSEFVGCGREYVRTCARRYGLQYDKVDRNRWTSEDISTVLSMRDQDKATFAEIGKAIGKNLRLVHRKYHELKDPLPRPGNNKVSALNIVPPEREDERRYRRGLEPRSITAAFFGDPLPGYSALERRA